MSIQETKNCPPMYPTPEEVIETALLRTLGGNEERQSVPEWSLIQLDLIYDPKSAASIPVPLQGFLNMNYGKRMVDIQTLQVRYTQDSQNNAKDCQIIITVAQAARGSVDDTTLKQKEIVIEKTNTGDEIIESVEKLEQRTEHPFFILPESGKVVSNQIIFYPFAKNAQGKPEMYFTREYFPLDTLHEEHHFIQPDASIPSGEPVPLYERSAMYPGFLEMLTNIIEPGGIATLYNAPKTEDIVEPKRSAKIVKARGNFYTDQ